MQEDRRPVVERTYRFASVPSWVIDHPETTATDVLIFATLDVLDVIPTREAIAWRSRMSVRGVARSLARLRSIGAILVEPLHSDEGSQIANRYILAGDDPFEGQG